MIHLLLTIIGLANATDIPSSRLIQLEITVAVTDIAADAPIDVYIPVAQDASRQTVKQTEITANIDGAIKTESVYGNQYWHGHADSLAGGTVTVTLSQTIQRSVEGKFKASEAERALFLKPNSRVAVSGPLVEQALSGIPPHDDTPRGIARSIYDMVVDTMDYKKTGTGWGNGDTEWACTRKYGNCTDFHAMFTSMARARNIPARFEIGYPVPLDKDSGTIGGYHCWLELALPDEGWFPVDASEAKKNPEKTETYFGSQPLDRVQFTVGRDLTLEGQQAPPLNYFIYPHVEVSGKEWKKVESTVRFSTPTP